MSAYNVEKPVGGEGVSKTTTGVRPVTATYMPDNDARVTILLSMFSLYKVETLHRKTLPLHNAACLQQMSLCMGNHDSIRCSEVQTYQAG